MTMILSSHQIPAMKKGREPVMVAMVLHASAIPPTFSKQQETPGQTSRKVVLPILFCNLV
jgi:hypothetical protein